MALDGLSNGYGTGTGGKGVEIALSAQGIHEEVSIGPSYDNQPVRMGDQAVTVDTMVGLGAVSAYPVQGRAKNQHRSSKRLGNEEFPQG